MKRKIATFFTLFFAALFSLLTIVSCAPQGATKAVSLESVTQTMVVMKVDEAEENASALSALTKLKEDGLIEFTVQESSYGAYITSINGKAEESGATSGYSWMLYTSDTEFSTTEFGVVEYNGVEYGQAALGASSLIVKSGEYYIWYYTPWSF